MKVVLGCREMGVVSVITMGVVFHGLLQLHPMGVQQRATGFLSLLPRNERSDALK